MRGVHQSGAGVARANLPICKPSMRRWLTSIGMPSVSRPLSSVYLPHAIGGTESSRAWRREVALVGGGVSPRIGKAGARQTLRAGA